MGKYQPKEMRDKAFAMFVNGMNLTEIARLLGTTRQSVGFWKKSGGWDAKFNDIKEKTQEQLHESMAEVRVRQIKICKGVQAKFIEGLRTDGSKITAQDADRAMKHELLLLGEVTSREEMVGEGKPITYKDLKEAYDESKCYASGTDKEKGHKDTDKTSI